MAREQSEPSLTRAEQAYLDLKERILTLEMPPGSTFSENELATSLELSKTPVREGLSRLVREGLVFVAARSGYRVAPITVKDTRDLCEVRTLLEIEAAGLAAERCAGENDLVSLAAACDGPIDPTRVKSVTRYLKANTRFHRRVGLLADNVRLAFGLTQVLEHLERVTRLALSLSPERFGEPGGHHVLATLIGTGDVEGAREAARADCLATQAALLQSLLTSDRILSTNVSPLAAARD